MKLLIIFLLIFYYCLHLGAQTWSSLGQGIGGTVTSLAVNDENNLLYAGGAFQGVKQWDGNQWTSLISGPISGFVYSLYAYDGLLYVSGENNLSDKEPLLATWDGFQWDTLITGITIYDVLYDSNANLLYVSGDFTEIYGDTVNNIAFWDGNSWSQLKNGTNGVVNRLFLGEDDKLYVGGKFTKVDSNTAYSIAYWYKKEWFSLDTGLYDSRFTLSVLTINSFSGNVYAGHGFSSNMPLGYLIKWNGVKWSNAAPGLEYIGPNSVHCAHVISIFNGSMFLGGCFTTISGKTINTIALWDESNMEWKAIDDSKFKKDNPIYVPNIRAMAEYRGNLYVAGSFDSVGEIRVNNIAKLSMPTVSVTEQELQNLQLTFSPNPARFSQQVLLERSTANEPAILNLYDLKGELLQSLLIPVDEKRSAFSLEQSKGIYLYQYQSATDKQNIQTGKLLLLE